MLAVAVGVVSFLLGLAPYVVEPVGMSDPVSCGSTWFRGAGLPAECYAEVDAWALAAKTGLVVAAVLLLVSVGAAASVRRNSPRRHRPPQKSH